MLLGFQRRFAKYVQEGSKTHTIRGRRRTLPRVGETCHCYVNPRQKSMRLLGRWPCVRVDDIRIEASCECEHPLRVWINGDELSPDEVEALFERDGFREKESPPKQVRNLMLSIQRNALLHTAAGRAAWFWRKRLPFTGHIIHWAFDRRLAAIHLQGAPA